MKRRDFLKMIGIAVAMPAQLLLKTKSVQYFPPVVDGGGLEVELEFPSGIFCVDTIWIITAQKYVPEIYGFHFQADGLTFEDCKERFDKAREYLRISQPIIELKVAVIGDMIVGDVFNLEVSDKRICGEYRIIKIEEKPKNETKA